MTQRYNFELCFLENSKQRIQKKKKDIFIGNIKQNKKIK